MPLIKLEEVLDVAQAACKRAIRLRNRKFNNQAVNWADFGVVEVRRVILVSIEEADPGAYEVRLYIQKALEKAGYSADDVEVQLEW